MQEYIQCLAEYAKGVDWYVEESANRSIENDLAVQMQNIFNNRSLVYYRLGDYCKAAEDAKLALEIDGCNEKSMYRRALALVMHIHDTLWTSNIWYTGKLGEEALCYLDEAKQCLLSLPNDGHSGMAVDIVEFLAQVNILHDLDAYKGDQMVERFVQDLKDDIDGNDDVDVSQTLEDLIETIRKGGVSASVTLLRATNGFRLLWYFMNDANAPQVCRLVEAANVSCVFWPKDVWGYLMDHACACKGNTEFTSLCMAALLSIIQANKWVKLHLFTRKWNDTGSLIQNIITTIGSCHLSMNCIGQDAVLLGCDIISCYANINSIGSNGISKGTKSFNTIMQLLNVFENADEIVKNSRYSGETKDTGALQEIEARAKEELMKKRDAVYNPSVVLLRKHVLSCITHLCNDRQFVIGEFVDWKDGKKCASQLHHKLVSLGRSLIQNCPKRSKKVLDMMLNPVSYEKKPYAADFIDNPTGDFLATMDLENPSSIMKSVDSLNSIIPGNAGKNSKPVIEMFLDIILALADMESQLVASLLLKAGILSICQMISEFETISTVILAQKIFTGVISQCKDSKKVLSQYSNLILLTGVFKYAKDDALQSLAIDEMCCLIPSCQGNDFIRLLDKNEGVLRLLNDQMSLKTPAPPKSLRLIEELAKRTLLCGNFKVLPSGKKIPKGYDWGCFKRELLEDIIYRKHCLLTSPAPRDDFDVACFSKGFLKASDITKTPDHDEVKPAKPRDKIINKTKNDKNIGEKDPARQPNVTAPEMNDIDEDDCSMEVNEVYDSTPAEHIRASRVSWLAVGEKERVHWEQTSTDLSVFIKVPKGTATEEVSVDILSSSITVRLKWYGKILHGELFDRVKSKECTWCLLDDEIQLVLPKYSQEHWWKTLIKGWEEKGYYDILKDAVDADEPHVSYDDMDESAKDLLDSMLERQAYINAGMLDLENGFDDFRIVLSDSSLRGEGGSSRQT